MTTERRKADHLRIGLQEDVQFKGLTNGLERYRFVHQALPELDYDAIDLSTTLLGHPLRVPILISAMTGGTQAALRINRHLAAGAQAAGAAMGVGSQRAAVEDPALAGTYRVRDVAPDILLLANLGAVQLNYGYGLEECRRAVEMIEADALILHLNPLQECVQEGGDTDFSRLADRIATICAGLEAPVVVKEVGWGISEETARLLVQAGVAAIDVAGSGGTSWAEVEARRAESQITQQLAATFAEWGLPTAESLRMVRRVAPGIPLIASGGMRNGLEGAKALALGADAFGLATPFLRAADQGVEAVSQVFERIVRELRTAMFCSGLPDLAALKGTDRLVREPF